MTITELKNHMSRFAAVYKTNETIGGRDLLYLKNGYLIANTMIASYYLNIGIDGEAILPASEFFLMINTCDSDEFSISFEGEDTVVVCGSSKAIYPPPHGASRQLSRVPAVPVADTTAPADLEKGAALCKNTLHKDSLRYSNVLVTKDYMLSTDSYRISKYNLSGIKDFPESMYMVWSASKVIADHPVTKYTLSEHAIVWELEDGGILVTPRELKTFDDLIQYTTADRLGSVKLSFPKGRKPITRRIASVTKMTFSTHKADRLVEVRFTKDKMAIRASGVKGDSITEIDVEYSGDEFVFKINPEFLIEGLQFADRIDITSDNYIVMCSGDGEQFVWIE